MMLKKIKDFLKEEEGLAAVEYAVLAGVVIAGVIALAPVIYDGSKSNSGGVLDVAIKRLNDALVELKKLPSP